MHVETRVQNPRENDQELKEGGEGKGMRERTRIRIGSLGRAEGRPTAAAPCLHLRLLGGSGLSGGLDDLCHARGGGGGSGGRCAGGRFP